MRKAENEKYKREDKTKRERQKEIEKERVTVAAELKLAFIYARYSNLTAMEVLVDFDAVL